MMQQPPEESPQALVAQFVLECKGKGAFLPYSDYGLIEEWLKQCRNVDELLLILDDVLPDYFSGEKGGKKQLSGVHKLVIQCLSDRRNR